MCRPGVPARFFRSFKTSPEVIQLAVLLYVKYPLSLRSVDDLLSKRTIDISHKTACSCWNTFGPLLAATHAGGGLAAYETFASGAAIGRDVRPRGRRHALPDVR